MKVQVLYDETGTIHAIMRPSAHSKGATATFMPTDGQSVATLDIPHELQGHTLLDLHDSITVDLNGEVPRLATKK
jgi:hypothetical protein